MESSLKIDDSGYSRGREDPDAHHSSNRFEISPKGPSEALKKRRKASFSVNAARRYRYTMDVKKFEETQRLENDHVSRLRAGTHVIRVEDVSDESSVDGSRNNDESSYRRTTRRPGDGLRVSGLQIDSGAGDVERVGTGQCCNLSTRVLNIVAIVSVVVAVTSLLVTIGLFVLNRFLPPATVRVVH